MHRVEILRKFDDIVAFAEVEKFVDTAVKHYSSGMYMRLAFAVAAHLETEILLVDEVLAVGDAAFQRKCLGKMEEVAAVGRTVLFVSHNMGAIAGLCKRGIWIDEGRIQADGPVDEVTTAYLSTLSSGLFQFVNRERGLTIREVVLRNGLGQQSNVFAPGDDLIVELSYEVEGQLASPNVQIVVQGLQGSCFTANMVLDGQGPHILEGAGKVTCRFNAIPLLPQSYTVRLSIRASDGREALLALQEVASFTVDGSVAEDGFRGELFHSFVARSTPVVVPYEWTLPDGSIRRVAIRPQRGLSLPKEPATL
jgi:lipopolysaccharide transport system ATP-binding protein